MSERWRVAMERALYGPGGFFVADAGPAAHFRTSVHASPLFAAAILRLAVAVDSALGHPARLDLVDVGAGRGELLAALLEAAPAGLRERLAPCGVELAPRPARLDSRIAWSDRMPTPVRGLLLATEWLDNVPLDLAEVDAAGEPRYVLVDPVGTESPGPPVEPPDTAWLDRWWPLPDEPGARAEIGLARDSAWAGAVATIEAGLALCVEYGHLRESRPWPGTLTAFRDGRESEAVPDGTRDLTASVAMDSVAAAGQGANPAARPYLLLRQREALRALGISGVRPALDLASRDPVGYVRALAAASQAGELTDPAGLGGHWWLLQPVGVDAQSVSPDCAHLRHTPAPAPLSRCPPRTVLTYATPRLRLRSVGLDRQPRDGVDDVHRDPGAGIELRVHRHHTSVAAEHHPGLIVDAYLHHV
jgi:SAM-dependent MidA family methyltransferase